MAREPQGRSNITVLVAATVGALVIVALNDLALAASGWSVKVFVLLAGVLAGVSARAADRAAAARLATHVGVITLGVVIVGDVILGVLAVGDPTVALDWQTAAWALGAGLLARLVADGFEPFDGSNRAQVLNAGTLFEAILEKRGVVGTRLRCLDANGKKTACIMTLFKPPAVELESSFTQGEWLPKLGEGAYYFVGEADGYLPANSGLFGAGEDAQAVLQTPTNENAAKLSVTATRAGKPLAASVLVRGVDGSFVTAEQKAPASFTLAKAAYKITVQAGGAKRSERAQLGEDKAVEFVFEEGKAYVNPP